ncbi:hypothetical protein CPB83DRAFT_879926 [Crepidotus variabilis]|uniref:Uncharacterized protein n=1 Tax=Crepidotus variabilis TaxID=179855 RepID=A0A9P6JV18_9AGAR|nr:hypothetical protein CPB83DRAFT_879926 [Crepidotus variabilis]
MSYNSSIALLNQAQVAFHAGDTRGALEWYYKGIKKILNDENVTALAPTVITLDNYPHELLGLAWSGFLGCFKDSSLGLNENTVPEAYKLLKTFRPESNSAQFLKWSARFQNSERGRILLKGLQISVGFTLGLMAWNNKDRATAARRYQEALDLAQTHAPFMSFPNTPVGLERCVSRDVKDMQDNLEVLEHNDTIHASLGASLGQSTNRRDVVEMPDTVRMKRTEGNGKNFLLIL